MSDVVTRLTSHLKNIATMHRGQIDTWPSYGGRLRSGKIIYKHDPPTGGEPGRDEVMSQLLAVCQEPFFTVGATETLDLSLSKV